MKDIKKMNEKPEKHKMIPVVVKKPKEEVVEEVVQEQNAEVSEKSGDVSFSRQESVKVSFNPHDDDKRSERLS